MAFMNQFRGVALITGAGGTGIGAAVAKAFATVGCSRIAITDHNEKTLAETHREITKINPRAEVWSSVGDISNPSFATAFVRDITRTFSRIDYSIHCAGILGTAQKSHETSIEDFDRINNVNYKGTWLMSRAALAQMIQQEPLHDHPKQRGSVVNVASQLGIVARPQAAAIINMTKADAIDYSSELVRVNCVCPGVIATPMTTGSKEVEERLRPAVEIAPMARMGTPEEVADAILFLCSSQASFIQGHALVVDGGYTIN
ncbi:short chain dehydrogenase reductase [Paramyrothecium foliicola]|nr:short chain dehydrogenase reductase [Paramyrothecium foliicola]